MRDEAIAPHMCPVRRTSPLRWMIGHHTLRVMRSSARAPSVATTGALTVSALALRRRRRAAPRATQSDRAHGCGEQQDPPAHFVRTSIALTASRAGRSPPERPPSSRAAPQPRPPQVSARIRPSRNARSTIVPRTDARRRARSRSMTITPIGTSRSPSSERSRTDSRAASATSGSITRTS